MLSWLVERLTASSGRTVYLLLFGFVFADAAPLVGFLLPGEAPLLLAGAVAGRGAASLWAAAAVATLAAVAGDSFTFFLGRLLGPGRAVRWGHRIGVTREALGRAETLLERHGRAAVFGGRFASALRAVVPLAAGVTGYPYARFLSINVPACALWSAAFMALGYTAGDHWESVARWFDVAAWVAVAGLALWALRGLWRRRSRR